LLCQFGGLFLPASIISTARSSHVSSSVSVTTSLTPMNRSQNWTFPLRCWNPGCETVSNPASSLCPRTKRGAVALTGERKQHIALTCGRAAAHRGSRCKAGFAHNAGVGCPSEDVRILMTSTLDRSRPSRDERNPAEKVLHNCRFHTHRVDVTVEPGLTPGLDGASALIG
jgi:hypothetical protein